MIVIMMRSQESLKMSNDGITVLTSSLAPYSFNEQGMSKGDNHHYQVRPMHGRLSLSAS